MNELVKDKYRTAYKRMFEIDRLIRAEKYPAAAKITEKLEVSKRTVQRDLRYMEMVLSAPLAYSAERHGYIYRWSDFSLSDFSYTASDVAVFSLAWRLMDSLFSGTFYSDRIKDAFSSIAAHIGEMPKMANHAIRENVQIALANWSSFQRQKRLFRQWTLGFAFTA